MLDVSREFIVLAACLNYTKAAQDLNVSQSSLSRHITDLEKELGFRLFDRNPMALTTAGRFYMESISKTIEQLDAMIEQGRLLAEKDSKSPLIYMLPSNGLHANILYESVSRSREKQPGFSPRFQYNDRQSTVFDAVVNGKADIGVLLNEPVDVPEGFACEWLVESPAVAWLHKSNPLLKSSSLRFDDLWDCYLLRSTNQSSRTWSDGSIDIYRKHGLEPRFRLKDLENKESFFLNLDPDEVLLASDEGLETHPCNPCLVAVRFEDCSLSYSVYLFYKKQPNGSALSKFVETCHRVAQAHRGGIA